MNNAAWHTRISGTSISAPYVAGVIALMLEANEDLTPTQVERILKRTARDYGISGKNSTWGAGEVNVFDAVRAALGDGTERR